MYVISESFKTNRKPNTKCALIRIMLMFAIKEEDIEKSKRIKIVRVMQFTRIITQLLGYISARCKVQGKRVTCQYLSNNSSSMYCNRLLLGEIIKITN